jgi:hypothetical protein
VGYGRLQHRLAWRLRSGRRRLLVIMRGAGLVRRRLAETLLADIPGSPEHAFIDAAWVALERERHTTVRAAMSEAVARFGRPAGGAGREPLAESARAIAGLLAGTLFEARLEMLLEAGRIGGADAMRGVLAALHAGFPAARDSIVAASASLAEIRLADEDIAARIHAEIAPVLAGELAACGTAVEVPPRHAAAAARRSGSLGGFLAWTLAVTRLVLAEFLQRESALPRSEALDTNPTVVATRRNIQHFARDVGLNVAAIFLMLALFAAVLMGG